MRMAASPGASRICLRSRLMASPVGDARRHEGEDLGFRVYGLEFVLTERILFQDSRSVSYIKRRNASHTFPSSFDRRSSIFRPSTLDPRPSTLDPNPTLDPTSTLNP